jgi:hypothetical protein
MRHPKARWGICLLALLGLVALSTSAQASSNPRLHAGSARGFVPPHGVKSGKGNNKLLLWHNGAVLTSGAAVTAIYWGPKWADSSFVGDKVTGLATFFQGVGGSTYANTNTEYTDSTGHVSSAVSYGGNVTDLSATPSGAPSTSQVLAVVARNIKSPVSNGFYPVYSDIPRGSAGYCAWHSYGTINGRLVQFGFFFSLDGDPGCDPGDTSGLHSQGLSALANVSGHELSETLTDPDGAGWYAHSGDENADECAWTFGHPLLTFKNGSKWRVQGNWSNNAYYAGTSYLGSGSGCIDGG